MRKIGVCRRGSFHAVSRARRNALAGNARRGVKTSRATASRCAKPYMSRQSAEKPTRRCCPPAGGIPITHSRKRRESHSRCAGRRLLVRDLARRRFSRASAVVYVAPGKVLRLRGALGPFQGLGVDGSLTWSVKSNANGTEISVSYAAEATTRMALTHCRRRPITCSVIRSSG